MECVCRFHDDKRENVVIIVFCVWVFMLSAIAVRILLPLSLSLS